MAPRAWHIATDDGLIWQCNLVSEYIYHSREYKITHAKDNDLFCPL